MKFAIIKDPHFRFGFNRPIGRKETFFDEIKKKLDFVSDTCINKGCKNVIFTGDVMDKKNPSDYSFSQYLINKKIISDFKDSLGTDSLIMSVYGNHDLKFSSVDNINSSILHSLCNISVINSLEENPVLFPTGVNIYGVNYRNPESKVFDVLRGMNDSMSIEHFNVVVLHQHFTPFNDSIKFVESFKYEDLVEFNKINMFVMGHIHKGYPVKRNNGVCIGSFKDQIYISPWSFVRLARDYYSVSDIHKPQMVIVDISDKYKKVGIETIEIPHNEFSKSFISDEISNEENSLSGIDDFISAMNDFDSSDDDLSLIPEDIREKVIFYLDSAEA